jgi:hypothetical protein
MSELDQRWMNAPRDDREQVANLMEKSAQLLRMAVDEEDEFIVGQLLTSAGVLALQAGRIQTGIFQQKLEVITTCDTFGQFGMRIDGRIPEQPASADDVFQYVTGQTARPPDQVMQAVARSGEEALALRHMSLLHRLMPVEGKEGLAQCEVCKGAEAALPSACPGRELTAQEMDDVQDGKLDFWSGRWWLGLIEGGEEDGKAPEDRGGGQEGQGSAGSGA